MDLNCHTVLVIRDWDESIVIRFERLIVMMDKSFLKEIEAFAGQGALLTEELLSSHTTFRVGGKADAFLSVQNEEQIIQTIKVCEKYRAPFFILGNGSNLLVSDEGYRGLVIAIGNDMAEITVEGDSVTAQAGALLSNVSRVAAKNSLSGMEFASGIPGTIGGAIVMNAGAYDGEMKNIVTQVRALTRDGNVLTLSGEEMEFGYRMSRVKKKGLIVLSVTMLLEKKEQEVIYEKMNDFSQRRREKQPLEYPSAGSTFKRPEGMFAGKLIMDAGLRGYSVGDAQVSEKHCGFVINKGNATAKEVRSVIRDVQEKVKEAFGVELETEVIFVGDF